MRDKRTLLPTVLERLKSRQPLRGVQVTLADLEIPIEAGLDLACVLLVSHLVLGQRVRHRGQEKQPALGRQVPIQEEALVVCIVLVFCEDSLPS